MQHCQIGMRPQRTEHVPGTEAVDDFLGVADKDFTHPAQQEEHALAWVALTDDPLPCSVLLAGRPLVQLGDLLCCQTSG